MKTYNVEFTSDELHELRSLICSKMLEASEHLDKIGNSNDALERKLFSYWYDKFQILKSSYDKLFYFSYNNLCEVKS